MDKRKITKYDWKEIQAYYDEGHTWKNISEHFGVATASIQKAKDRGDFKTRTASESLKIYNKKHPQKHSEETKKKISIARKKYLKENPDKVPYLLNHYSKGDSYPEKYFKKCFSGSSFKPKVRYLNYELDFADLENGIDVEIDGDQHHVDPKIVKHDKKRNDILLNDGFKIIRIWWSKFQKLDEETRKNVVSHIINLKPIKLECVSFLGFDSIAYPTFKIILKKKNDKYYCKCGNEKSLKANTCRSCYLKKREKIEWPSKEELEKLLWEIPSIQLATRLGVSDKAIEKRAKKYNISKPPRGYWKKIRAAGFEPAKE